MFDQVKRLLKHSAVYGLGDMGGRIVSFLLIPIVLRFLSPEDYGILEIFQVLKNLCLAYLLDTGEQREIDRCLQQLDTARNMTDSLAALSSLAQHDLPQRQPQLDRFYEKWQHDAQVVDKWFAIQAASPLPDALDKVRRLTPFFEKIEKTVKQPDMNTSAGYYMYTPDDQPLIGPVPEVPGFYVNCGYWAGVMLSPQAGKRISELVTGKMDPKENPLRPTRFKEGLGKKGKTLMSH